MLPCHGMRPPSLTAAAALVLSLLAGAAGCDAAGPPGRLEAMLDTVPAEAAARGLLDWWASDAPTLAYPVENGPATITET